MCCAAMSRAVLQQRGEPAIDFSRPPVAQRSIWFSEYLYNKPAVMRKTDHPRLRVP